MESYKKQYPLLLPISRSLIVEYSAVDLLVREIPEWLARFLGKSSDEFVGLSVYKALEEFIPGLSELIRMTVEQNKTISGFKAFVSDVNGHKQHLLLDSFVKSGNTINGFVSVAIQQIDALSIPEDASFFGLIGRSVIMQKVFNKIRMYAASEAPVLVTGETGSGKEGVATAIHQISNRSNGPFITMNCSVITDTLFESELFGHEKGSFTGAINSHRGRFERADGGTLFLDEIGDLQAVSQAKLLRALETSKIERVGSEKSIKVNVRIVVATNHNLEKNSQNNLFRPDLLYRVNALHIIIPPLRERSEDIELLIQHFIKTLNKKYNRQICCLTREAIQLLKQYQWPGNVRELKNLMERLFAENQTDAIGLRSLREWYDERMNAAKYANDRQYRDVTILPWQKAISLGLPTNTEVHAVEKKLDLEMLKQAYQKTNGNITKASELLGIHKATFYRALKSLKLHRNDLKD